MLTQLFFQNKEKKNNIFTSAPKVFPGSMTKRYHVVIESAAKQQIYLLYKCISWVGGKHIMLCNNIIFIPDIQHK